MPPSPRHHSAAAQRNQQPILDVLRQVLPAQGAALEIASGSGQHAAHFAAHLPGWTWQPSDATAESFASVAAWRALAGAGQVRDPVLLDVLAPVWPTQGPPFAEPFDALYCANMLHISPGATCAALMRGAAKHLTPKGLLITYGPYLERDVPTSPGNLAFDESLRLRNPDWGLRALEDVASQALLVGFLLHKRLQMPANNLLLVFGRKA